MDPYLHIASFPDTESAENFLMQFAHTGFRFVLRENISQFNYLEVIFKPTAGIHIFIHQDDLDDFNAYLEIYFPNANSDN